MTHAQTALADPASRADVPGVPNPPTTTRAATATGPAVGDLAPDFTLVDQYGADVSLSSVRGAKLAVVVFYPFAFSGICTGELRAIRDGLEDFQSDDIQVFSISCDPMYALRAWADAEGHFFPLLSDFWPHGEVSRAYGVFNETDGFALRGTFLIDRDGRIAWSEVKGLGEARSFREYRAALTALRAA
jgi:peroxiredoxin (alkyl hydroperoxide reductase subunit C)